MLSENICPASDSHRAGCLTVFLADMSLFAEMNAGYAKYFEGDLPARSAIAVKALPKGALVEIESIAAK